MDDDPTAQFYIEKQKIGCYFKLLKLKTRKLAVIKVKL
jgi:hypothetical protein